MSEAPTPGGAPRTARPLLDSPTLLVAAVGVAGAAHAWGAGGWARVRAILSADLGLLVSVAPKLLAGSFIGALVPLLLPRELVGRHVGGASGLRGLLIASLAGAVLPGGPFTIFPVAAGLLAAGADAGAAVAFVTSWLLNGLMRTLVWELPFMGSHYVLARLPATLLLPLLAGVLARRLLRLAPRLGRDLRGEGA